MRSGLAAARGAARAAASAAPRRWLLLLIAAAAWLPPATAGARNHSELEWRTLTTEHFLVHFHQGAERSARRAAVIAEEIYPAVTGLYDFEPEPPTHLIVRDTDDYANGAAFYYDDKFEIWATALEFELRGTHNWLRDVITHEFTHMVQLQSASRFPHRVPAVYLQGFGYEQERRPDVLIGYPNVIVSYPLAGTVNSAWLAEGVAQYQTAKIYNDWWDTHRDMLLRSAVLDSTLLTYTQMGDLQRNGLEAERVYNQGNNLVRWIAAHYGEEALREIARGLRRLSTITESAAFKHATGHSAAELYEAWKADLEVRYQAVADAIRPQAITGETVSEGGYLNLRPRFQPGTDALYWLSNQGSDYASLQLVRRRGVTGPAAARGAIEAVMPGAGSAPAMTSAGRAAYYAKRTERNRYGSRVFDLYRLDLEREDEERLTVNQRLKDPCPSPDGAWIVAVRNGDGTNELVLLNADGTPARDLTSDSPQGTQYYEPSWSADGRTLLYGVYRGLSRDIMLMDVASGSARALLTSPADERNPIFTPDGEAVLFASDRTGIFDIYRLDLASGTQVQVTNVYGGAFYPAVAADGTLAFAAFTGGGYALRILRAGDWGALPVDSERQPAPHGDYRLASAGPPALDLTRGRFFDGEATPYQAAYPVTQFMPRLLIDHGRPRVGLYVASREILEKQSVFGGASVGRRSGGFEFEGFALYENRMLPWTLFGDAFRVRRRSEDLTDAKIVGGGAHVGETRPVHLELRYDLLELDVGGRYDWGPEFSSTSWNKLSAFFAYQVYHINLFATDDLDGTGYGKDGWNYYIGRALHASYDYRAVRRAVDSDVNPRGGRQLAVRTAYNWASLNPTGQRNIESGVFRPVFENNRFAEFEADWHEYLALPWGRHTLELRARGATIDDPEVDDFFHYPLGSQPGLRGYTYYSRQARKLGLASITYRLPILARIDRRVGALALHRLYGGVFFEAGNAWNDAGLAGLSAGRLLKDAGFELRLDASSFYVFPAAFEFQGAYGIDEVEDLDSARNITGGKSWRYYFRLLFGY